MTYRAKGNSTSANFSWTSKKTVNGGSPTYTYNSKQSSSSAYSGLSFVGYSKLKSKGYFFPHTPFSKSTWSMRFAPTTMRRKSPTRDEIDENYSHLALDLYAQLGGHSSQPNSSAGAELVQSAASAIATDGFDASTFIGEVGENITMLRRAAAGLVRVAVKTRGNPKRMISSLDDLRKHVLRDPREVARLWLQKRYGWDPLIRDLTDLHKAVTQEATNITDFSRTKRMNSGGASVTQTFSQSWSASTMVAEITKVTNHSVRGSVGARIKRHQSIYGDLPATAWELVPYSFVADWVISVGNAINAARLWRIADMTTASVGIESETTCSATAYFQGVKSPFTIASFTEYYSGNTYNYNRSPTSISLKPIVRSRPLSALHAVDLSALIYVRKRMKGL